MRENVLAKRAFIVGVRGLGQGLRVRVGDEGLLSRNDQVFPERPGQEVSPVGLQPVDVAFSLSSWSRARAITSGSLTSSRIK
jgi:hypothetical protein